MSEDADRGSESGSGGPGAPGSGNGRAGEAGDDHRPSLTSAVRRRRTDQEFFLRLRDAIQQNHKALERLGT
jgi:hypothetical protein